MKKLTKEEKRYTAKIDILFEQIVRAKSKQEAIEKIKQSFLDDYGLELSDEEIKSIKSSKNE